MRNETFTLYIEDLIKHLLKKYPNKEIVIQLDNVIVHRCMSTIKIVQSYEKVHFLYGASTTPEFSCIENLFGSLKRKLKDFTQRKHYLTAIQVICYFFHNFL